MTKNLTGKMLAFMLAAIIGAGLAPIKAEAADNLGDVTIIAPDTADHQEVSNTGGPHSHSYEWLVVEQATEFEDGKMVQICSTCGYAIEGAAVISAYGNFNKGTIKDIQNAPPESIVNVDAGLWISFSKDVIGALTERSDVMLNVDYKDKGENYSFFIPAGGAGKITDEADYYGFHYLTGVCGVTNSVIGNNVSAIKEEKECSGHKFFSLGISGYVQYERCTLCDFKRLIE